MQAKRATFSSEEVDSEVQRLAQCDGKRRYPNRKRARLAAERGEKLYWPDKFNYYFCSFCDGWHTGHKPKVVHSLKEE